MNLQDLPGAIASYRPPAPPPAAVRISVVRWRATLCLAIGVMVLLALRWLWLDARADQVRDATAEAVVLVAQQASLAQRVAGVAGAVRPLGTVGADAADEPLPADEAASWHALRLSARADTERVLGLMAVADASPRRQHAALSAALASWASAQQQLAAHSERGDVAANAASRRQDRWADARADARAATAAAPPLLALLKQHITEAAEESTLQAPALLLALAGVGLLVLGWRKTPAAAGTMPTPVSTPTAAPPSLVIEEEPLRRNTPVLPLLPAQADWQQRLARTLDHAARHPGYGFALLAMQLGDADPAPITLGSAAADELEHAVVRRLLDTLRPGDAACRRHADGLEFLVVLDGLADPTQLRQVVQRLHEEMAEPYTVCDHPLRLRLRLGVLAAEEAHGDIAQLLHQVDLALAECVGATANCNDELTTSGSTAGELTTKPVYFTTALGRRIEARQAAALVFQRALSQGEFALLYQPVLALDRALGDGARAEGVRTELRWRHPERGLLEPAEFMADAAEARCAAQIDDWQLRSAALQFTVWRDALGAHAPRWVSVALSPDANPQLVQTVTQLLQQQRLAPAELELRLQEHALTADASAATTLQRLRELGVRLALEGLGQGSASLSALSRLRVCSVIIDRHFVRQAPTVEAHRVLIKAITSLGTSLGIVTVADGISSDEQRCTLLELGVQLGHGELFAAPLPVDELALWMMARTAPSGVAHHTP